jgi:hypothetical protein
VKARSAAWQLAGLILLGGAASMPGQVLVGEGRIRGTASLLDTASGCNGSLISTFLTPSEGVSSAGFSAYSDDHFSYYMPPYGFWIYPVGGGIPVFFQVCAASTHNAPTATSHLSATGFAPLSGTTVNTIDYRVRVNPLSTDNLGVCLQVFNSPPAQVYYPWFVDGTLYLNSNRKMYVLNEQETATDGSTVKPWAGSVFALRDFKEYPGLIHLSRTCADQNFYDGAGSLITARITSGTPLGTVQAEVRYLATSPSSGGINETFAVRGGLTYQLDLSYHTGTDPYGLADPLLFWFERQNNVLVQPGCQVDLIGPSLSCSTGTGDGCFFGAISGQVDLLNRYEIPQTEVRAYAGPMGNYRYGQVPISQSPSSGAYLLPHMMPTDQHLDPTDPVGAQDPCYTVYSLLSFCNNGFLEDLQSPVKRNVCVLHCTTNDLGNTFVMTPTNVSGALHFTGPDGSVPGCPDFLQNLVLPSNPCTPSPPGSPSAFSHVSAGNVGPDLGSAQALFSLSGSSGVYNGAYDLTLASLNGQTTSWDPNTLNLSFISAVGALPANHIREGLVIYNSGFTPTLIPVPAGCLGMTGRDHDYCFSDVTILFTAAPGASPFFSPSLSGGGFGANYSMSVSANGTPVDNNTAVTSGEIHLCLPAGTYTLTPSISYQGGGSATLPNITFTVECNQCLEVRPGSPSLVVSNIPCITGTNAVVSGTAAAQPPSTLAHVECWVNGISIGTTTTSPFTFNFPPPPLGCGNLVVIKATDSAGLTTTVQQSVKRVILPLTISGCQDIVVNAPPGGPPVNVNYNNVTAGNGGCPVTLTFNPPAPGPFPLGTTPVTCTAEDACGNTTNCTFNVIVQACPTITDDSLTCTSNRQDFNYSFTLSNPVGGTAIDHCLLFPSPLCFNFSPATITPQTPIQPGGSATFNTLGIIGTGCPKQLCYAIQFRDASNNIICSDIHCFDNPALPRIDCPPDIMTNCMTDDGVYVSYVCPTATSLCCSNVSVVCSPLPGLFHIGVTPVTCVAIDSCGYSNVCTFNVTVVGHGKNQLGRWLKSDGMGHSSGSSRANAIAVDAAGDSYVGGTFSGSVSFLNANSTTTVLNSTGGMDIFLAKYDTTGKLLWVRSAGGSAGNDEALGVAVDALGNCFVTGAFTDSATFSTTSISGFPGAQHAFVAKYDPQGNVLWALAASGLGPEVGAGVAVDDGGNCYVTGDYRGGANFESTVGPSSWFVGFGSQDCFLAKYDADGVLQWVISSSGSGPYVVAARGVAVDPSGLKAWITGYFSANGSGAPQFGTTTPAFSPSTGGGDAFVAQCDVSASPAWTWARQTFRDGSAGSSTADGRQIGVDNSGNSYFAAYFKGPTGMSANNLSPAASVASVTPAVCNTYYNHLVGSLDSSGNPLWLKEGAGCGDDEAYGLAVNGAGETFVSGFLQGAGTYVSGGRNVMLLEYDSFGILDWTGTGTGTSISQDNVGLSTALDKGGCVYMAGSFTDTNLTFSGFPNPTLSLTSGSQAMFVAKYCPSCSNCIAPQIVAQPQSVSLTDGPSVAHPVSFSVTASGTGPLSYYWYRGNTLLNPGGEAYSGPCYTITIVGAISTLKLTGVPTACTGTIDSGNYMVSVQNNCCDCPVSSRRVSLLYMDVVNGGWQVDPSRFTWGVSARTGQVYQVDYRDDLKSGTIWRLLTNGVGTGSNTPIVDPHPNPTNRFYRVVPSDSP